MQDTKPIELSIQQHAELMRFAFAQICDPKDWKGPIDAIVPWDCANVYMQAVQFMTAVQPVCERVSGNMARITCIGYRRGPAA